MLGSSLLSVKMSNVLKSRNGGREGRLTLVKLSPVSKVTGLFFNFPVTLQGERGGGEAGPVCSQRYRSFRGCRQEMESPRARQSGDEAPSVSAVLVGTGWVWG